MVQHALPGSARPGERAALRLLRRGLRLAEHRRHDRRRAGPLGLTRYWLAHTMRAIQSTSDAGSERSLCAGLSERSSTSFAVLRFSSLARISPSFVLITTRSPLRRGAAGEITR